MSAEFNGRAAVVTVSDSAANGQASDDSGPLAGTVLSDAGWQVVEQVVVADEPAVITNTISRLAATVDLVVTTGGTGIGPRDVTPEAITQLDVRHLPGIGERIRAASRDAVPTADLSRTGAWAAQTAVILALPGSPGGVRDGLACTLDLLPHAIHMLVGHGHDHRRLHTTAPSGTHPATPTDAKAGIVTASLVTDQIISAHELADTFTCLAAGAVVTFDGRVRDHDHGRPVTSLRYEAHPDAQTTLAQIADEAASRVGTVELAVAHRVGELALGDAAFCVAVSSAHRQAAFDTCRWLVDTVKARLPVWKLQTFGDGTSEWVNCA